MKLLTPPQRAVGKCQAKKSFLVRVRKSLKAAQAKNKDAHNVLIYSEVEQYFSATSDN